MSNKITKTLLAMAVVGIFTLTGCRGIYINLGANKEKLTSEETKTVEMGGAEKLYVEDVVGAISVNKTDGGAVKVRTKVKVEGPTKQDTQEVMDNIATSAEVKDGRLEVKAVTKDGKEDFWTWKSSHHNGMNVNIDFYVDLPKDLESYEIKNVTGNIDMAGLAGTVNANNVTGNITIKDAVLADSSKVELVTGNIKCAGDIAKASGLEMNNVTGSVELTLPASAKFNIKGNVVTGSLSGSYKGLSPSKSMTGGSVDQSINGGGTDIKIKLVTGNISVNEK